MVGPALLPVFEARFLALVSYGNFPERSRRQTTTRDMALRLISGPLQLPYLVTISLIHDLAPAHHQLSEIT